jgi:integrase
MKLTKASVAALKLPPGKPEHIALDDDISGFGVRLRAGGSRNYIFQYRQGGKQRRLSFGAVAAVPIGEARDKAAKLHAQVKLGHDPAGAKIETRARAAEIVEPIMRRYLARQHDRLKARSYEEVERHLLRHAKPLHGLQIAKVDRRTIAARLAEIAQCSGPVAANRVRTSLSAFFVWCMKQGLIDSNPVINTNKEMENDARDRVLKDAELRVIWHALDDDQYGAIVKLLMLTGQRRDEIGGLARSEIDSKAATITLPPARTKNKREHIVPLSAPAQVIIAAQPRRTLADGEPRDLLFGLRAGPFSGWSDSKEKLDAKIVDATGGKPLPDWTLHDLRRSAATGMADLGVQPHVIEAVLNHASGHKAGVAGIYNRSSYERETKAALDLWGEHVLAIVEGRKSKVVSIRGTR